MNYDEQNVILRMRDTQQQRVSLHYNNDKKNIILGINLVLHTVSTS